MKYKKVHGGCNDRQQHCREAGLEEAAHAVSNFAPATAVVEHSKKTLPGLSAVEHARQSQVQHHSKAADSDR